MQQLTKLKAIVYHLYPGLIITLLFCALAPVLLRFGFPPQLSLLICIPLAAIPVMLFHLQKAKNYENKITIAAINGFDNKMPAGKLFLYSLGLVITAFIVWAVTQPLNKIASEHFFSWLPYWFTSQDLANYDKQTLRITLLLNLLLNGFIAPIAEELYFRGYLLARMQVWGKWAFVINALLFSLYHLWQPQIYLTLLLALLPMTWMVWKTRDIRIGILTHCMLNITGALLSFGSLTK